MQSTLSALIVIMPEQIPTTLIGELIKNKILSKEDAQSLSQTAQTQNKDIGRVLVEQGIISDEDLATLKSKLYRLPLIHLEEIELDREVLKEITEDVVTFYKTAPFAKEGNILRVGIINPEDVKALEALKFIASNKGLTLEKYIISYKDFDAINRDYRTLTGEVGKALESLNDEFEKDVKSAVPTSLEEITAEAPVTKIVAVIIRHAVESRASDIHIEPFEDRVRTRFRIDGILNTALTLPKNLHSAVVTRIKILSDLKIDETRLAQDGRFATRLNDRKIDFRVSTFPTKNGEKVVMRILDPLSGSIDLPDLGLQGRSLEVLERAMTKPFGSILITGPTGSGKSTTLAGLLKRMNTDDVNIVTLEDPIEYYVPGVNQSQIHEEIGYTFASGLRHILRQDPDIIMVGEIRDHETAALATQAALTGHIVLSTLHTNDSIGVVPRLIDMSVEKYLIPSTLNVAAAQRLLRKLCPDCKVQTQADTAEVKIIEDAINAMPSQYQKQLSNNKGYEIYKPNLENPCKKCGGKSFKGRIGIFEMMEMTPEFEQIILGNLSDTAMKAEAKRQGMITMFQDGILKVLQGTVSLEELLEVAQAGESA
ncbi:Flp pilus assembly complex ATPase component TadA [Candidatus Parcubacteria bacterium]|nr:Flp pilus assembly complex ATPase component TadA [Candidatus Parcubacteria bacterium]